MRNALIALMSVLVAGSPTTSDGPSKDPQCKGKCWDKKLYQKARKATPYHPIPLYIVRCESQGILHRVAMDGLGGGRYQIIPSTWQANLPSKRFIGVAGGNKGPIWSSRLLQDKVAHNIARSAGLSQWVCA
jgi:hypothetical protein